MSTLKVNNIQDATGNNAISIDSSGNVTLAAGFVPQTAMGRRNLIINGAMQVWQRGTSGFGHSVYFADRWVEYTNTDDGLSISLVELPSGGETGLPKQLTQMAKFALTAGSTGGLNDLRQKVENPKGLMGQTVTLSYYIKASANCTINNRRIEFASVTNAPASSDLPSVNVTTEWQRVVDTVTLNSSGSAVFSAASHLDVVLSLPVHTTVDVYITGVQLEVGSVATPFEHRSYGEELALCQRYYLKYKNEASGVDSTLGMGTYYNSTQFYMVMHFPVTMRANPTFGAANGTDYFRIYAASNAGDYFSGWTGVQQKGTSSYSVYAGSDVNGTAGQAGWAEINDDAAYIYFDAEL